MLKKIDAHQHFWKFNPIRDAWISGKNMAAIRKDFLPDDLYPILKNNAVEACVAIQADQSEEESLFLLDLAAKNDFVKGVVGWVNLLDENLEKRLDYFTQFQKLKGFRHILQGKKPEFMLQNQFIEGLKTIAKKGYTYDILVYPKHLKAVHKLLQKTDNQPLIIDHIAKPTIQNGLIKQWAKDIKIIAKYPNLFCKLSGLVTEANWEQWQEQDFEPYLDIIFEAFGVERLFYGSDFPVCLLAATYEKQLSIIENYISKNAAAHQSQIFRENAIRFYNLTL